MEEIDTLEHFTISRRRDGSLWELGRGAMGITYKALDTNLQSEVALKVISAQYLDSEPARQRFLREARAAASLRHPNVATVFHLGKVEGRIYYAMEYVNGETVERRVQREGPMHPLLALRIVRQVTGVLVAADREKLVHRDIKPSNIMLALEQGDDQLLVKVIDFGLAKSFISLTNQSGTLTVGGFVGTPHFASPEQLEEKEIDVRSDIYSLGATLWYMLTGHPPFEGVLARVIYQHIAEPLPTNVLQQFSPGPRNLLEKLLAKKPENRFQTSLELKAEVDALLKELGDNPIAVSPAEPLRLKEGTSVSGIAIGQLIRNRYLILSPSPFGPHTFKAEDLQSDAQASVALRFLPLACTNDPRQLAEIHHEIERLREVDHPNLLRVNALESYDGGLFISGEWTSGFTLQVLLRCRRQLTWQETIPIAKSLAAVLDFASERQLLGFGPSLREIFLETPDNLLPSEESKYRDVDSSSCKLKVDSLSLARPSISRFAEPAETVVDGQSVGHVRRNPVELLASLLHELMGGVKSLPTYDGKPVRLNPLPNLSETGNIVLRNGVLDSAQFESAGDFLEKLEEAEAEKAEVIKPPAQPEVSSIPAELPSVARSELRETESLNNGQLTEALTSSPSPGVEPFAATLSAPSQAPERQRGFGRMAAGLAVVLGFCAIAGFYILQASRPAPKGKEVAQASPQITEKTPAVITVPETAPSATPQTTPASETATIRVPSGPPAETTPEAAQAAPTAASQAEPQTSHVAEPTIPEAPQFGDVLLTSDPPGAGIYQGNIKLGETPLTISFPAESVELTSRFKMLAPVQQRFTADPKKNIVVEFRHEYGSVVVQSDQPDTSVVIDATSLGKAPLTQLLAPGHHQVAAVASGRAAETQEFNIEAKETKTLHFDLARVVDTLTASPSPTPAATSSEGLPAQLTAPGLKPEAEGSVPSTSQPGSTPSNRTTASSI